MIAAIFLDSSPLSLLTQRRGVWAADACRAWLATQSANGIRVFLPEVVDYELRRELLRAQKHLSIQRLDALAANPHVEYLPLTTRDMRRAAELWAEIRQRGAPTADPAALDVDVILAAQILTTEIPTNELVVATSNPIHLSLFVPAKRWQDI